MKITVEWEGHEPITFVNVTGTLMLLRVPDGVRKAILGDMSLRDMVAMMKTLNLGEDAVSKKLKLAANIAELLTYPEGALVAEETPDCCLNDPFSELLGGK